MDYLHNDNLYIIYASILFLVSFHICIYFFSIFQNDRENILENIPFLYATIPMNWLLGLNWLIHKVL